MTENVIKTFIYYKTLEYFLCHPVVANQVCLTNDLFFYCIQSNDFLPLQYTDVCCRVIPLSSIFYETHLTFLCCSTKSFMQSLYPLPLYPACIFFDLLFVLHSSILDWFPVYLFVLFTGHFAFEKDSARSNCQAFHILWFVFLVSVASKQFCNT